MPWGQWGQPPADTDEEPPSTVGVLAADRYCPRCDKQTRWTNEHDALPRLRCLGCGYMIGAALTDDEQDRAERYDATPVRRRRHAYKVV